MPKELHNQHEKNPNLIHDFKAIYIEKKKLGFESILIALSVFLGLICNIAYDGCKNSDLYKNTLKAIQAEAKGNDFILDDTFDPGRLDKQKVVFRDMNLKIVETGLCNSIFAEKAENVNLDSLINYLAVIKQINAHRAGLEKLYWDPTSKTDSNKTELITHLIDRLKTSRELCKKQIAYILTMK